MVRKVSFFIVLIFGIYIKFLDLLFLDKFMFILLALPSTLTTLLLLALNAFKAKSNNLVAFKSKINSARIQLKP